MDRTRSTSRDRREIEDQQHRLRTVSLEQRLRETIAWSAALLADHLARSPAPGTAATDPDPAGLGTRRV